MAEGCSGSSFVFRTLGALAIQHGFHVWSPLKEFLMSSKLPKEAPYCTEPDGTPHYWKGDPHHAENLQAAWSVLNGSITCTEGVGQRPTLFLFDGHVKGRMADVVPFLSR